MKKFQSTLLVGSALGLLLVATPATLARTNATAPDRHEATAVTDAAVLAQADPAGEEELPRKLKRKGKGPAEAPGSAAGQQDEPEPQLRRKKERRQAAEPEAAPDMEQQAEPQPRRKKQRQQAAEPEAAPDIEQQAEPQPRRKKQRRQAAEPEAAPDMEQQAEPQPRRKKQRQQAAEPEAAPDMEQQAEPQPRRKKQRQQAAEPETAPDMEQQGEPQPRRKKQRQQAAEPETAPDIEQQGEAEPQPRRKKQRQLAEPEQEPGESQAGRVPDSGTSPQPEGAAPVLDSAKEAPGGAKRRKAGTVTAAPAEPAAPPPRSDRAAQERAQPGEVQPLTAEQGQRVAEPPPVKRKRPQGVEVVREDEDRVVVEVDNQIFVQSSDRPRLTRGARDIYYENLPDSRTRETVVRDDGVQVVTIRNVYGDVVRRSRIMPDGHEYVLVYVDDRDYDRLGDWRDPGLDLPPLRLGVPVEEYILDAGQVDDYEVYYEFLERPPVEPVERLYSVDEVKRSARIRDKVPRIELDTITFEFGSASIAESEVPRLEGVAEAMGRLLEKNPAETFLIEGHTDAVGSDVANLQLSDRRAEAVAEALTNVFDIPPENLATQGYGERFLKVETDEPERLNRRVVIRRITPLVAPVASAD